MAWALTRSSAAARRRRWDRGRWSVAGAMGADLLEHCLEVRPPSRSPWAKGRPCCLRPPPARRALRLSRQLRSSTRSVCHIGLQATKKSARPPRRDELVVDLVALGSFPGLRFGVLGWMRLARALAARRGMWLLAERLAVRIGRVARVRAALVGIRPLGGIRLPHGVVQVVVRLGVVRAVAGILG